MTSGEALSCKDFPEPIETPTHEDVVENLSEAGLTWVFLT